MCLAQQVQIHTALTAENQEERPFFNETALTYCENSEAQITVFACYGDGNLYKELLFVYLQPSVNENS